MKKHILGFWIFSFIFVSFAAVFAFYYVPPIPNVEEVKTPVYVSETRTSCLKNAKKTDNLSFEVLSSQYLADENKVISKVRVNWKGKRNAPERIYVSVSLAASRANSDKHSGVLQNFEKPFAVENSKILTVVTNNSELPRFEASDNIYAFINVSDEFTNDAEAFGRNSQPTSVLFVHGENSKKANERFVTVK